MGAKQPWLYVSKCTNFLEHIGTVEFLPSAQRCKLIPGWQGICFGRIKKTKSGEAIDGALHKGIPILVEQRSNGGLGYSI